MGDFTDALINDYDKYDSSKDYTTLSDSERAQALKEFRDALKIKFDYRTRTNSRTGIIDVDNFHKAHDKELKELDLLSLFNNSNGLLINSGSYGKIKEIDKTQYPDLVKDISNFWGSQFRDRLKTKDDIARDEARERRWKQEDERFEQEKSELTDKFKLAIDECISKLNEEPDIKKYLTELKNTYLLGSDIAIWRKDKWSTANDDDTGASLVDDVVCKIIMSFPNSEKFKPQTIYRVQLKPTDVNYFKDKYNEIKEKVSSEILKIYNREKPYFDRDDLVKKITGKDINYFHNNAKVILADTSNKIYVLDILRRGYEFYIDEDKKIAANLSFFDLDEKPVNLAAINDTEFPLEIVAVEFRDYSEHNINSIIAGHTDTDSEVCITNKATSKVYKYLELVKEGNKVKELQSRPDYLTEFNSTIDYNKKVNGVIYPVVVSRRWVSWND